MFLLLILLAFAVFALAVAYYTFRICFFAPADRQEDPYSLIQGEQYAELSDSIHRCVGIMERSDYQWVSVSARDGTVLWGRYYHTAEGAPVQILFHGYRSMALRDSAGGFILGKKLGYNILAIDQRGHGRSDGHCISFGIRERQDCVTWAEYVSRELSPGAPIILGGLSMGAATVLMASELSLPREVVCIVADCPYASPKDIIQKVCREEGYPPRITYPFIWLGALAFGGFRLDVSSAESAVQHAKLPILLFHGEDDRFVPCEMSHSIHRLCSSRCVLHTFPYAGHGLCYMTDPRRYERCSVDFFWSVPSLQEHLMNNEFANKERFDHD